MLFLWLDIGLEQFRKNAQFFNSKFRSGLLEQLATLFYRLIDTYFKLQFWVALHNEQAQPSWLYYEIFVYYPYLAILGLSRSSSILLYNQKHFH